MSQPLLEVTSHILGKNAKLRVFPDRIEWERASSLSAKKLTAGVLTGGLSLAVTGVSDRKHAGTETIPIRAITSVATRRDSLINDVVVINAAGSTVEARCSKADAAAVRQAVLGAMSRL